MPDDFFWLVRRTLGLRDDDAQPLVDALIREAIAAHIPYPVDYVRRVIFPECRVR